MPDGKRKQLKFMNLIEKILLWWARRQLIWQQKKNIASFTILENYITDSVLKGGRMRNNQLIDIQNKLDESKRFLKFLQK